MRIYRQKGYVIQATKDSVAVEGGYVTLLTLVIKSKEIDSKYIVISKVGERLSYTLFKNLIVNPDFRRQYLATGYQHCTEPFNYLCKGGLTLDCRKAVYEFNKKSKENTLSKSDYATLKTYGNDKFSNLSLDDIRKYRVIRKSELSVRHIFSSEEHVISTFRWMLRGLNEHDAIQRELLSIIQTSNFKERFVTKHLDDSLLMELK